MEVIRRGKYGFEMIAQNDFDFYVLRVMFEHPRNHAKYFFPEDKKLFSNVITEQLTGSNICDTIEPPDKPLANSGGQEIDVAQAIERYRAKHHLD